VYFIANEGYADSVGHQAVSFAELPNPKLHKGSMWILVNIYILWKISSITRKRFPKASILLLSYETVSFSIGRLLFSNLRGSYIFNHNNIDQLESSAVRRLAFRTLRIPTIHLVYESFIKNHLEDDPKFKAEVVSHPLVFDWIPLPRDKLVNMFVPHMLDLAQFNMLNKLADDEKKFKIRAKFYETITIPHLTTMPYFPDFDKELGLSNIVLVFTIFKYRASGVAYAAISSGRILIIKESIFSSNLAMRYPGQVFLFSDIEHLFELLCKIGRDKNLLNVKRVNLEVSQIGRVISK